MKKTIPKRYNPKEVEEKIYRFWERAGLFRPESLPGKRKKSYTICLPPPNITGSLHIGHTLNAILQDILIRKKRMEGFKTLWIPGTDHAGIATQNVVEKELKKEGKTRFDLGKREFVKRVWQWKKKYGEIILEQFKKIGICCDWSRKKFTLDKDYTKAVYKAFEIFFKRGQIYRAQRVINWCKRCQTSLSDLELDYKLKKGKLWYLKYPLKERGYLKVATTRPETMLGDTALAVNQKDKRYKKFIGKKAILPLLEREIPVIADDLVDPKFGTGVVKITPAHDPKDYIISLKHNLPLIKVINEKREIISPAPQKYVGKDVLSARKEILQDLKNAGFLIKEEEIFHKVPFCDRCKTEIEFLPSWQWFLKMEKLAELAKEGVKLKKVKFHPKKWEKIYFDWLNNIRDWCISRQLWWGHRLPLWECKKSEKEKRYFFSSKAPKKCAICKKCKPKKVEDVLDTWFSSALWPFASLGWPKKTNDFKTFFPTNTLASARDIINLWVGRMIFCSKALTKKYPFSDVIIHPTVLTKEGKRMSKSLGTGVDPLELIKEFGTDPTRFGIIWQTTPLQDIRFTKDHLIAGRKFTNKLWNAGRFILTKLEHERFIISELEVTGKKLTKYDREIIKELKETAKKVDKEIERFEFGKALKIIYRFFWHKFCDFYIERAKVQLEQSKEDKKRTLKILLYVFLTSLKLLHPFLPFITEKIYQILPLKGKKKSIMIENWPKL